MKKRVVRRWLLGASSTTQCTTLLTSAQRLAPSAPRRGILLLVVLSMLTLFLLIGTAFIVSADHFRKTQKTFAKQTQSSNSSLDQGNLLDEVINQLVRDTNNQNSSLRFHSLLQDMYGNDGLLAEIEVGSTAWANARGGPSNPTNGQMLQFTLTNISDQFGIAFSPTRQQLSIVDNAYNGLVLTFLGGPLRGQSTRIVGYLAASSGPPSIPNPIFRVMAPRKADGSNIKVADFAKIASSRILINGRPFNGTGAGYNPSATAGAPRLNASEDVNGTPYSLALMPNAAYFDSEHFVLNNVSFRNFFSNRWSRLDSLERAQLVSRMGPFGLGGSDESYDAVDFQNMILALMPSQPSKTRASAANLGNMVLPSLHRPALINYWRNQLSTAAIELQDEPNLLRKVLLRPNWLDHPNFTGGNPEFANIATTDTQLKLNQMIYGPWDVDNDGDGVPDSVWVDFGAEVMENADGRMVKPLAAIMVLDMGGRLNLNAHGSEDMANSNPNPAFAQPIAGTASNTTNLLPQGQGFGTAEISLGPLMPGTTRLRKWDWYKRFFTGADLGNSFVPSGSDFSPANNPRKFIRRRLGRMGSKDIFPGRQGFDMAAQMKMQGMPLRANRQAARNDVLSNYATPPDLKGRYAVPSLNNFGQPVYEALEDMPQPGDNLFAATAKLLNTDSQYETDLSLGASRGESTDSDDAPYSLAELERILRPYDPDAGTLPSRIWEMAGEFKNNSSDSTPNLDKLNLWRTSVTTDSYDLPVPNVAVPEWMVSGTRNKRLSAYVAVMGKPATNATFADLLEYRIRTERTSIWRQSSDLANPTQVTQIQQIMAKLLPPDLADGLRLDINRPFGNGRDDNNNGVVDEPGEDEGPYWKSTDPQMSSAGFTDSNDGKIRDERILLEDRNNDNVADAADLTRIGVTGTVDTFDERIAVHNLRRQMMARDMFVMALTLVDPYDLTTKKGKAKTRQLAQWAINTVDFRDPDNIMTAFEYDSNPFDGWVVDGNASDVSDWQGADLKANTNDDFGGVVWGAESPEMLISETLAWHDRRTENHGDEDPANGGQRGTVPYPANDPKVKIPDDDYDQRFVPLGAGFVELLCPLPENPAANEDTHLIDSATGEDLGIDLAAVDKVNGNSPCWRLMIYKTNLNGSGGPSKDPDAQNSVDVPKQADRCVYFTDFDPETVNPKWDNDGVAFYTSLTNQRTVRPGKYLVVGAGKSDGGTQYKASFGNQTGQTKDSERGIVLDPSSNFPVSVQTASGTAVMDPDGFSMQAPANLTSVAVIDMPRRFTFSEPSKGYPLTFGASRRRKDPTNGNFYYDPPIDVPLDDQRFSGGGGGGLAQGGGGGGGGGLGQRPKGGTKPFADGESRLRLPVPGAGGGIGKGAAAGGGLGSSVGQNGRTIPGFSWVYLQRLANPLLPWNPEPVSANGSTNTNHDPTVTVNPYMTIDASGVNVTVFNGLSNFELRAKTGVVKKGANRIAKYPNTTAARSFSSLQRGRLNDPLDPAADLTGFQNQVSSKTDARILGRLDPDKLRPAADLRSNLWNPESVGRTAAGAVSGLWRNKTTSDITHNLTKVPDCTLGFLNEPFRGSSTDPKRTPEKPFPWYTWNNRPYANANELMLVPAYRSSQLLKAFSYQTTTNNKFNYDGKVKEVPLSTNEKLVVDGPFTHLLNFFRTNSRGVDGKLGTTDDQGIAGLYRMFDYIHVPSPFVGTETWLSPVSFGATAVTTAQDPRYLRQPPFNRIAEYREPGRVNLNTIVSADVWDGGILHRERFNPAAPWHPFKNNYQLPNTSTGYDGHIGPLYVDLRVNGFNSVNGLLENRRGYSVWSATSSTPDPILDNSLLPLDPNVPTFFANPYRSADASNLVPLPQLRRENVDCLVLRSDKVPKITNSGGGLNRNAATSSRTDPNGLPTELQASDKPALLSEATEDFRNAARNPYFSFQPMTRLSSMTTNRSNVYAVWVTVGFFEVERADDWASDENNVKARFNDDRDLYDRVYPEGYQLGREAGSDTGDIRRVREFAMIDRTVPVAFEPGKNHNVDKAIRLRRRIE